MAPFNLGLMNKAAPLLMKYRRLHYEYTKDIDMSRVEEVQNRIDELKTAIAQIEPAGTAHNARLHTLKEKLIAAESELSSNASVRNLVKLYRDTEGLAMYKLITDTGIIKPFLVDIMIPTESNCHKVNDLDFNDRGILGFIKEVITDFFSYTLQNRPE